MTPHQTKYDRRRLLFRRQFILGPRFTEGLPNWTRFKARPSICLTVHPDLPTYVARSGNTSVVLLGYILDPDDPKANDSDIVKTLILQLQSTKTPEAFIRLTYPFGGRWILIVDTGQRLWLFNDPCGYRQVYYTHGSQHGLWCASQPGLLAETLGLGPDGDAMRFIRAYRKRQPQYWWPGDTSPYREVRHLLPNHYLDMNTGTSHRFWPVNSIQPRTLEEVVAESVTLLQRIIESASHRSELALPLTAGKDTRLLLAASKAIRDQPYCFTCQYWDMTSETPDIQVPSRLLPKLGLSHHVIHCPSRMDREFAEIYRRNVTTAHEAYGPIIQGLYHHYPQNKVSMKGCAAPITGVHYRRRLRRLRPDAEGEAVDPLALAQAAKIPEEDFALEALDRWLLDVNETSLLGFDPLTLFLWEDREANWQAMTQLEGDISREVFVPFNCRLLLANMLSVPEQYRVKPTFLLQREMMLQLWPEVLSEPINPHVEESIVLLARKFLRKPGCMNWRWLGSKIAERWHVTGPTSQVAHETEAQQSF